MRWQRYFLGYSLIGERKSVVGLVLRLVEMLVGMVPIFVGWWLVTSVEMKPDLPFSGYTAMGLLILCLCCQLLLSYFGQLLCFRGGYDIVVAFRRRVAAHLRNLPLGYFVDNRLGETASLLTDDTKKVEDYFTHFLAELLLSAALAVVVFGMLMAIDYRLALATICLTPLGYWGASRYFGKFMALYEAQQQRLKGLAAQLIEYAAGLSTLRIFQQFDLIVKPLFSQISSIRNASMGVETVGGIGVLLFRLSVELGVAAMFVVASHSWSTEADTDLNRWLLVFLLTYVLIHSLIELSLYFAMAGVSGPSGRRLVEMLNQPVFAPKKLSSDLHTASADFVDASGKEFKPAIQLDNISFGYRPDKAILKGISFAAQRGTFTAITGRSGCGKSTLLNLISCFYQPNMGQIYLDGVPYGSLGTEAIYQILGVVFQDSILFSGSVAQNILLGRPDASQDEVMAACRAANCHEFITALPEGYETLLGEGGARLSGGERQRLSIARMLVKDPEIIIVDEMTAQLDPINQHEVQQALSRLAAGRTVVMVAHRLHTIRSADQIIVLDQGQIAQLGKHDQLIAQSGLYRELWLSQSGGAGA